MIKDLSKKVKKVGNIFIGLASVILAVGVLSYENYKGKQDFFIIYGIGLLTFITVFFSFLFTDKYKQILSLIDKHIDNEVTKSKENLIRLVEQNRFDIIKNELEKIDSNFFLKQNVNVKFFVLACVFFLLFSTTGFLTFPKDYLWLAFISFWGALLSISHIISLWYFIWSEI